MPDNSAYKLRSFQIINTSVGTTGGVTAFTTHAKGTNYVPGDTITPTAGSNNCVIGVDSVDAVGGVTGYWIIANGNGYSVAATVIATSTTSTAGADFTAVITAVTTVASTKRALSTAIPSSVINTKYFISRGLDQAGNALVSLTNTTCQVIRVEIQALYSNAGFVAIGYKPIPYNGSTYSALTSGIQLAAGQVITLENVDLSDVYMLPGTNNDGVMVTPYIRQTL